jgi:hypothetical protein
VERSGDLTAVKPRLTAVFYLFRGARFTCAAIAAMPLPEFGIDLL